MNQSIAYRLLILLCLLAGAGTAWTATTANTGPSPDLAPAAVVRAQLQALRQNGENDHGIARAYRFASPGNRRAVGDLASFTRMLKRRYADMLTQTGARLTVHDRSDDRARVIAELEHEDGHETAYVFILSRQHGGGCDGCWMTDGVLALEPAHDEPLYSI